MKELIQEICSIPGVAEACVFNKSKGPIYFDSDPGAILNGDVLQTVGMHFIRLIQMGGMAGLKIESTHFYFNKYVVIGIVLDANTVALIICEAHVNCSLVTTTVSMLATEIREEITTLANNVVEQSLPLVKEKGKVVQQDVSGGNDQVLQPYFISIQEALASVIGPVAGVVLRDSKSKWIAGGPAIAARLPELIEILAGEIGDDSLAVEFKSHVNHIW